MALIEDFSKFVKISILDSEPDLKSTDDSQNESEELWTMGMLPPDEEKRLLKDILIKSEELRGIPSYDEIKQLFNNDDEEDDLS